MNRKQFLITSGLVSSGAAMAALLRWRHVPHLPPLEQPWFLAHLFDNEKLCQIGAAYRSGSPAEDSAQVLTRLLLTGTEGHPIASTDETELSRLLRQKVLDDFAGGRIAIVDGWVLATTEARQCALLSIASR